MGGQQLVRVLDQLATTRGLPKAIRTDNGKEFCSRAMLTWAHARSVQLFLIEPGKPNQNAPKIRDTIVAVLLNSGGTSVRRKLSKV